MDLTLVGLPKIGALENKGYKKPMPIKVGKIAIQILQLCVSCTYSAFWCRRWGEFTCLHQLLFGIIEPFMLILLSDAINVAMFCCFCRNKVNLVISKLYQVWCFCIPFN
jgi:hypothetical protein